MRAIDYFSKDILSWNYKYSDGVIKYNNINVHNHSKKELPGTKDKYGRMQLSLNGKTLQYARVVWILNNGDIENKELEVDHINGNPLDNRIENLRLVSPSENSSNKLCHRNGKYIGVGFNKQSCKFRAIIGEKVIGYFDCEHQAAMAIECINERS